MLISRVPDETGGEGRGDERGDEAEHFQTANELFELMAKDHDFEATGEDPLTTRDLVLLYKNIDLGKQLMSNVHEFKRRTPNQYVETVIYQGQGEPGSESDLSESLSNEDLDNIVQVNKERIDMLTHTPSNTLCHKLGDMEIQTSFTAEYDRHFLFKDPYIKEQLMNLKLMSTSNELDTTMLPASLLDYICCKRLEDNYNFYMDNIIRYVKNTIEQLKRISNGDYLTDKAKQKWKEVENEKEGGDNMSKVLTTSTSIPLHVERKLTGLTSTWDDLVHSEVDLRSLAKILEKRIVVEVPKLICGSYKLFSNRHADNLVISCKRRELPDERASRVDVVLQLQRSETGQVVSNIDSIMILQKLLPIQNDAIEALPLTYPEPENEVKAETPRIIELYELEYNTESNSPPPICDSNDNSSSVTDLRENVFEERDGSCAMEYSNSDNGRRSGVRDDDEENDSERMYLESVRRAAARRGVVSHIVRAEASVNHATPEDMNFTIHPLNRQTSLPEENTDSSYYTKTKKKSPTRVRIKSPYENKSHLLEEKKRKKLLEVRERRERKKMAMNERTKVNKHKFCKSAIVPQASSSVTKLSITNKSFYNSIFGHNVSNIENAVVNHTKGRKGQKKDDMIPEIVLEQPEGEAGDVGEAEEPRTTDRNSQKYINRSYYLDEAVTEMYLQMKQNNDGVRTSASTSAVSNDSGANFSLSQSFANLVAKEVLPTASDLLRPELEHIKPLTNSQSELSVVPANSPKGSSPRREEPAEVAATVECRRSIDKIYLLMKKLGKIEPHEKPRTKNAAEVVSSLCGPASAAHTVQSDSGTSLKHQLTSSNPSSYSFEKPICGKDAPPSPTRMQGGPVEPKVIISSKQREKPDADKPAKPQKRVTLSPRIRTYPDNPLKAISQLLHEFDSVQKTRQKSVVDLKSKKDAVPVDGRSSRQEAYKRRPRVDQPPAHLRDRPAERGKTVSPRVRPRLESVAEGKPQGGAGGVDKRKLVELIEEAKEARGEAVRGPGLSSRLNALAQPKRTYVQPHTETPAARYPRSQVPERVHRQTAPNARSRPRRGMEPTSGSDKPTPLPLVIQSAERAASGARARRSAGSPERRASEPRPPTVPQILKKKMVAVESYLKLHYGAGAGCTARAPVLPSDIELSSMSVSSPTPDESAALGSKLHRIINSMCEERAVLNERAERGDGAPRPAPAPRDPRDPPPAIATPTHPHPFSPHFDNEDHPAVGPVASRDQLKPTKKHTDLQMFSSITELEMLESALYRRMSLGAFPKRLRINNLTLTPKHSVQQIVLLQSGDATSLVLKSKLSQNFQINTSKSTANETGFKGLSTTHLDWRFSQLPLQISTVGYSFPSYEREPQSNTARPENDCKDTDAVTDKASSDFDSDPGSNNTNDCIKESELCQCFKGKPYKKSPGSECAVQANDTDFASVAACTDNRATHVHHSNPKTVSKSNAETNTTDDLEKEKAVERHSAEPADIPKEVTEQSEMEILRTIDGEKSELLDYTTSLDMLVGLLNEIQKITTCTCDGPDDSKGEDARDHSELASTLESVTAALDSSADQQQLKTSSSLISLYVPKEAAVRSTSTKTSDTKSVSAETVMPTCASKEASAQFPEAQHAAVLTEQPRLHLASEISDTRSLMESVLCGPTRSLSMVAFTECHSLFSEPSSDGTSNIMRLREIGTNPGSVKSLVIFHDNVAKDVKKDVAVTCTGLVKAVRRESASGNALVNTVELLRSRPQRKRNLNKCCLNAADFDPMIKMKRDILVTVYSFLVLTVFAALSFPEMLLYHT